MTSTVQPLTIEPTMRPWLTKEDIEALDNGQQVHDEYGNYFYKDGENDYRYTYPVDVDAWEWDEDRYTKEELLELLIDE